MTTYAIRSNGNLITPHKAGRPMALADAQSYVRGQCRGLISVGWSDGSLAYYRSQVDADRDDTGERAIAIVTPWEVEIDGEIESAEWSPGDR